MAPVSARLLVLGVLARQGPMHGHEIRRWAELRSMDDWADIKVGALYGAINRLAREGLIAEERSERRGRLPARTVYRITDAGRADLGNLLQRAVVDVAPPPDPFDVALAVAGHDLAREPAAVRRRIGYVSSAEAPTPRSPAGPSWSTRAGRTGWTGRRPEPAPAS